MIDSIKEMCGAATLASCLDAIELELVDDPTWAAPDDHSYLTYEERTDPTIAANIEAMEKTNKLIYWVGRDYEGFVGLWRGPHLDSPGAAPVVRLDAEGQYSIVATNFADYILASVFDDDFSAARAALVDLNAECSMSTEQIFRAVDALRDLAAFVDPNAFRDNLFDAMQGGST